MAIDDRLKGLTDEQKEKARNASSPEELLALAKEQGFELTDEELEGVAGGWGGEDPCKDYAGCSDLS